MEQWDKIKELRIKVLRFLGSRGIFDDDADEIFQESCLLILEKKEKVNNLEALLIGYAKRMSLYQHRQNSKANRFIDIALYNDEKKTPAQLVESPNIEIFVEKDINYKKKLRNKQVYKKLSPRNREIIYSRFCDGMLEKDIANKFGLKRAAVEMIIHRFKKKLQATL